MSIEAMKQWLEALEDATKHIFLGDKNGVEANIRAHKQCESLRQSIAEAEKQEPVAWMYDWTSDEGEFIQDWTTSMAETLRDTEPTIISNVRPLYLHSDTTQRCYCGDIYRLGVVHREHSFCDEHPQEKPQCPDCGASVMYECVACGNNNYPEGFVKAKTTEFPVPLAWCRWSEDMQKWLYTSRQPTEELAWIPLYDHPPQQRKPLMLEKFREMKALLDDDSQSQRKTLTDDELKIIMETTMPVIDWKARYGVELNNGERNKWMLEWFIAFARAIEAAHGIKENT